MRKSSLVSALAALLLPLAASADAGLTVSNDIEYSQTPPLLLDVYAPSEITDETPLVAFVPSSGGGRWNRAELGSFGVVGPVFARDGVILVVPEHRLAPDVLFPNFVEDIARAVAWSWGAFPTDSGAPRKLVVAGEGTGAYVAAMVALDPRYLAAAGLPDQAVTGFIGLGGTYLGGDDCHMMECAHFFPEAYRDSWAASAHVGPDDPPMLLIAGEKDPSEGIDELEELAGPAARAGVEVHTLVVPGSTGLRLFIDLGRPGTAVHETVRGFIDRLSDL